LYNLSIVSLSILFPAFPFAFGILYWCFRIYAEVPYMYYIFMYYTMYYYVIFLRQILPFRVANFAVSVCQILLHIGKFCHTIPQFYFTIIFQHFSAFHKKYMCFCFLQYILFLLILLPRFYNFRQIVFRCLLYPIGLTQNCDYFDFY